MSEEQKKKVEENKRTVSEGLERRKVAQQEAKKEARLENYEKDMIRACNGGADAKTAKKTEGTTIAEKMEAKKDVKAGAKTTSARTVARNAVNCNPKAKDIIKKIVAPAAICAALAAFQYFNLDRLTAVRTVMFLCAIAIAFNAGRLMECRMQSK